MKSSLRQVLAAIAASITTLQGTDPLNTLTTLQETLEAMEGATFDTTTDSLEAIENRVSGIEGATFDTTTDSLAIIAPQIALGQVISAGSNPAILLPVTGSTNFADFNLAMDDLFPFLQTALANQDNSSIDALATQITVVQATALAGTATSAYTTVSVTAGVQQLRTAVANWLLYYPAP